MSEGVVLALGGGGARGLAHVGVLAAFEAAGIPVRAVVGTSIGAEVGGLLAAGVPIAELKRVAFEMDWLDTMRLFTPAFGQGALTGGDAIEEFLRPWLEGKRIEDAPIGYAAIAADLASGEEVVLAQGDLLTAVRASISFPGLIAPVRVGGRLLVDGGVVNPVPFDVARARFGGPVIAVYVHPRPDVRVLGGRDEDERGARLSELLDAPWLARVPGARRWLRGAADLAARIAERFDDDDEVPGVFDVLARAQLASEAMLVRLRERIAPPDLVIAPAIHDIGLLEFYRGREAFDAGFDAASDRIGEVRALLDAASDAGLIERLRRWWREEEERR